MQRTTTMVLARAPVLACFLLFLLSCAPDPNPGPDPEEQLFDIEGEWQIIWIAGYDYEFLSIKHTGYPQYPYHLTFTRHSCMGTSTRQFVARLSGNVLCMDRPYRPIWEQYAELRLVRDEQGCQLIPTPNPTSFPESGVEVEGAFRPVEEVRSPPTSGR